jgi:hypothetical protein
VTPDLAGAPPDALGWFALTLAGALALVAGIAAATLAGERARGAAGWMAVRAVPRASIVLAWFTAYGLIAVLGLVPTALLAWLSLGATVLPSGPLPLVAVTASAWCTGLAAIALGLLAGSLLPPWPALLVTLLLAAALLLPAAAGIGGWLTLPAGGLEGLARLDTAPRPIADALRAGGTALGTGAATLVLAVAAFEHADL